MPKITEEKKLPALVAATYREAFDDLPAADLTDKGIAVFAYNYRQLVNDYPERHGDRRRPQYDNDGLDRLYYGDYRLRDNPEARKGDAPGTIAMWSWGASRVMDYIQTQGAYINLNKVAISGHSRLGKTALLTGACDERFTHILSNASCAAGASLSRGCSRKEDLKYVSDAFPEWVCENLKTSYDSSLLDMHFLLACIAPRKLYIANADDDAYCDYDSEYLSCVAASEVYEHLGAKGFIRPDRLPVTGDSFGEGDIGYHLRAGTHAFPLEDWFMMLDFFLK